MISDEYDSFLEDLGISKKKKMKNDDDKPYVPPMGDLSKAGTSSAGIVYKWWRNCLSLGPIFLMEGRDIELFITLVPKVLN